MNAAAGGRRLCRLGVAVVIAAGAGAIAYGVGQWRTHRPIASGARFIAGGDYSSAVRPGDFVTVTTEQSRAGAIRSWRAAPRPGRVPRTRFMSPIATT